MRALCFAALVSNMLAAGVYAQELNQAEQESAPAPREWEFSGSGSAYIVPEDNVFLLPTFAADRDWLHLEARYNYEDQNTGSAWFGYTYSLEKKVSLELTPMLGVVAGATSGVAFGYYITFGWWWLELYTEGELMVDIPQADKSFFYSWTELTLSPVDWLFFGGAFQRTRAYKTEREYSPGALLGFYFEPMAIATYVFEPGTGKPTIVFAFEFEL